MSGSGALVGFALVFVLVAWTLSAALSLLLAAGGTRLRALGPAAERRVAVLAAVLPVVLAAAVTAALVIRSVAGDDHCAVHDHHAHLCLAHGEAWLERPLVVVLVSVATAVAAARLLVLGVALLRGRRAIAVLRAASERCGDVQLVDSPRPFCFVAGLVRPRIYASTAAWSGLPDGERAAMLAHERGHVRHRDLGWRALVEAALAFGAPLTSSALIARWDHATERLRDGDAADEVGDPTAVASALVQMCRLGAIGAEARLIGFPARSGALEERVAALLDRAPRGARAARVVAAAALGLVSAVTIAAVTHVEPLHHVLESLLG